MATDKFYMKKHDRQPYYAARAIGANKTVLGISNAYADITISATYSDTELYVISTAGFPSAGNLILSDFISVSYTGKTALTFTGCVWAYGTQGQTFNLGTSVTEVINLTTATVRFSMVNTEDNSIKINRSAATITAPMIGNMEYRWGANDTNTSGAYLCEFEITPTSGEKFTVPSNPADRAIVVIVDDLDNT